MTDNLTLVSEKRLRDLLEMEKLIKILLCEEGMKEQFLSYNVGVALVWMLEGGE